MRYFFLILMSDHEMLALRGPASFVIDESSP